MTVVMVVYIDDDDERNEDQTALFVQEVCSMLASLTSDYVAMITAVVMVVIIV